MNEYLNISQLESWMYDQLSGTVSEHVYAGTLPSPLESGVSEMCVVDVVKVVDTSEYGRFGGEAYVNVFCYIKPRSDGRKNVAKFNKAENALADWIETSRGGHYTVTEMYSDSGYDKSAGFHYKMSGLRVIIR